MKDPAPYLTALKIDIPCAVDSTALAVVEASHQSIVNWEVYFFSSIGKKKRFDTDVTKYCGMLTDPVRLIRFVPTSQSPRILHEGTPFYFSDSSSAALFEAHADSLAEPRHRMIGM